MPLKSPFQPIVVPDVTVHQKFFEYFSEHGHKIAMIDDISGKTYTYSDIIDTSKRIASGLVKLGVQKGDVFAVYSMNSPELVMMMWAVFCTGATVTGVNYRHTAYELKEQLVDSAAKFIYTTNDRITTVQEATKNISLFKEIVVHSDGDHLTSFEQLSRDDTSQWQSLDTMEFNPKSDVMVLFYSSGTTGKPKGVPMTHYNILYNSTQIRHPDLFGPPTAISSIVIAPLYHGFAFLTYFCFHMAHGSKLVIQQKFDAKEFLKAIEIHKVTHLYIPASVATALAKSPLTDQYNLSRLQHVYSGAAMLSKEVLNASRSNLRISQTEQVYGMVEASFITQTVYSEKSKEGSVGVLVPGLEGKVIDINTGDPLGPGEQGEICVRGPQIVEGYLNRPDATKEAFDSSGWFHTGDVGFYDEDNYVYIVDRMKDIFKVDGLQVSPSELEGVLFDHPAVLDVGVVGIPDESTNSKPKAFVVKKEGVEVTERQLCEHVRGILAEYKWLTGGVEFVSAIPKLPSGKILRHELREMPFQSA